MYINKLWRSRLRVITALLVMQIALLGTHAAIPLKLYQGEMVSGCDSWQFPTETRKITNLFYMKDNQYEAGSHRGVDFDATQDETLFAPFAGKISASGKVSGTPYVTIDHDGLKSTFQPAKLLSSIKKGDEVEKGQEFATVDFIGDTAPSHCTEESCIHWGVRNESDTYFNPLAFTNCCPIVLRE
ncbi:MAG: M23 family metallopeptidase [Bifidobacteriaceae bacterium]|jgi:murein DD-endopeptidase MepM/ murein hydrolase activator NlpD|nr:M23 family metallopeptidase [Bifidobacteriaceae bacterium]